jgi:hypothetical protein
MQQANLGTEMPLDRTIKTDECAKVREKNTTDEEIQENQPPNPPNGGERECPGCSSPIVLNLDRKGFQFTSVKDGVFFDLDADGNPERTSWIKEGSEDSFLVLDRNNDGVVNDGRELFGDVTPQPTSEQPNGFYALAVLDLPSDGGNNDGKITEEDFFFYDLLLWNDMNHDGVSQPEELHPLVDKGVEELSLKFRVSSRHDKWGNQFRYISRYKNNSGRTRRMIDVFFQTDKSE